MIDVLMTILILSFTAICGIFLALLYEHGAQGFVSTFNNMVEIIHGVKESKRNRTIHGS